MALTTGDLQAIREALKPDFAEMKDHIDFKTDRVVDQLTEVIQDGLELIDNRFNIVEERLDRVEHRLDNLRIVSNS